MNLRRALEEEMAEVPCDICGSQDHDYRHCQAGALPESRTPGILLKGYFVGVCVRLLRRMYLSMYWESFTHLQLMRGWNR